jgi:hypothetical protein
MSARPARGRRLAGQKVARQAGGARSEVSWPSRQALRLTSRRRHSQIRTALRHCIARRLWSRTRARRVALDAQADILPLCDEIDGHHFPRTRYVGPDARAMMTPMALSIDASRALRTPTELAALIAAVVAALPEDERDWLEWKKTLDLGDKGVQGAIARTILGMANRTVAAAIRAVGGFGYIVIGAEPGSVTGVVPIDSSVLGRGIQPFLGPNGPAWHPDYVSTGTATVLVVTVDPPRLGDRIRALDKETERPKNVRGTVLIRRPGETAQANPDEIRAMEDRFIAPTLASRRRERLEKIGDALGEMWEVVKDPNVAANRLTAPRDRLRTLVAGWDGPPMRQLEIFLNAGSVIQAQMYYSAARADIDAQLLQIDQEM